MSSDERVYTHMSGLAVKGLQRLARDREIFVRDEVGGFTVVTKGASHKRGWAEKRHLEKLSA